MSLRTAVRAGLLGLAFTLSLPAPALASRSKQAEAIEVSEGFLAAHPDINFRRQGLQAFEDGFLGDAVTYFTRSARYGDKASQAMLAEMYWKGTGVAQDRALAYAWMDLAAERFYPAFLALRERYWAELGASERERVVKVGEPLYAEFGDEVAKPRLERELRLGLRQMTGSRVGFRGGLTIYIPGPAGVPIAVRGSQYYAKKYWEPEKYWQWTDEIWSKPPTGRVDVGELERMEQAD
jgi:uncharacterized protein